MSDKACLGGLKMEDQEVVVTDVRMQFSSMVVFMVKWVIASIPALIILAALGALIVAFFTAFLRSLFWPY